MWAGRMDSGSCYCIDYVAAVEITWMGSRWPGKCFMGVCHATVLDVGDGGVESSRILEYGCRAW